MIQYNHRYTEILGIVLFLTYCVLFAIEIINESMLRFSNESYVVSFLLLFNFLLGFIGADFFSGMVHFLGDTFGTENTPIFGASFIKPFRDHHVDPKGMTNHDFVETSGNNCIVSLPPMIFIYHLIDIQHSLLNFGFYIFFLFLMFFVFITNQIHKWAHMEDPGRIVRLLQNYHLVLSPRHHSVHHTAPFNSYYCITVGWLNPLLYRCRFFEGIRFLAEKTLGRWVEISK